MTKKQKAMLSRIIAAFIIYITLAVSDHMEILPEWFGLWGKMALYLIPYVLIGWDIVYRAFRNIRNGQVFDENFLMTVATFGAFGVGEYSEAVAVMLFYQVGELFQSYAVNRSRQSITELMDICPEYANIEEDGQLKQVDPDDVQVGDIIVVKSGERIPLDGKVVFGDSMVDTSALTGESVPRKVAEGDDIISGCVNGSGLLRVQVAKEFDDSTVAKILELVENASSKKSPCGKLHHPVCQILYPPGGDGSRAPGCDSAPVLWPDLVRGRQKGLHLSGHLLPVRPGDFRAYELLLRHRRCFQKGCAHQGKQLSGGSV